MRLYSKQLAPHLTGDLAPVYLVTGDEPFLVDECCVAIREKARQSGYADRELMTVEPGFDWGQLSASIQSLSLFSERKLLELRIPGGRPGEVGAKALSQFAEEIPEDTLLLIVTGKLEQDVLRSKWVKALDKAGIVITAYPLDSREFPRWIGQRMQERGLQPESGVVERLAYYFEGNLLAISQEIEKLALLGTGRIKLDDIEENLSDHARFNVFGLIDACLQGNGKAAVRILASLHAEGVAPPLVLWAVVREVRTLSKIARELAAGAVQADVFRTYRVWPRRQGLIKQALQRTRPSQWLALLQRAARTDRVIKGQDSGDPWMELNKLCIAMCGARVFAGLRH